MNREVSTLYEDLPVKVDSDEVEKFLGIKLDNELIGDSMVKVREFLDTIHRHIYDFVIFVVGDRTLQTRLISKYKEQLEKPIKRALLAQAQYILGNGNIEIDNGVVKTVDGITEKSIESVLARVICPTAINILYSTKPCLLYTGQ
jgi:hypothetical protein